MAASVCGQACNRYLHNSPLLNLGVPLPPPQFLCDPSPRQEQTQPDPSLLLSSSFTEVCFFSYLHSLSPHTPFSSHRVWQHQLCSLSLPFSLPRSPLFFFSPLCLSLPLALCSALLVWILLLLAARSWRCCMFSSTQRYVPAPREWALLFLPEGKENHDGREGWRCWGGFMDGLYWHRGVGQQLDRLLTGRQAGHLTDALCLEIGWWPYMIFSSTRTPGW